MADLDLNNAIKEANLDSFDPAARILILALMNKVEELVALSQEQAKLIQQLRDENARLKGENGKPGFRRQSTPQKDISSEKERKGPPKKRKKKPKKNSNIKHDRVVICHVPEDQIPEGSTSNGYQDVLIQDISIKTDNILFRREVFEKPDGTTISGKLPAGYEGQYGPNIKAFVLTCHHAHRMSHSSILNLLTTLGIIISAATISRILTENNEVFHQEKEDIVDAGLATKAAKQMDDTGGRFKGKNRFVHILCNNFFTAYFTRTKKDRLTILEIIARHPLMFQFDENAYDLMETLGVAEKHIVRLKTYCSLGQILNQTEIDELFVTLFPAPEKHNKIKQNILEGSAISWYHKQPNAIQKLMTDDAPQYKLIAKMLGLCWIHDGRHYKKLDPYFASHIFALEAFLKEYWDYYRELLAYKETPTPEESKRLLEKFDTLFSKTTDYDELNKRIAMTKAKKGNLLRVLDYPYFPLHNNISELAARYQAMRRDSNYHTMSENGMHSKDSLMTIIATAKKQSINVFQYLHDRITKSYEITPLAELILSPSVS